MVFWGHRNFDLDGTGDLNFTFALERQTLAPRSAPTKRVDSGNKMQCERGWGA